jgi:type I restriction enzyme M protein
MLKSRHHYKVKKQPRKVNKGLFHSKSMTKFTHQLETATRKKIDLILDKLDWITDEDSNKCNIFTGRAKTDEQQKKFKGNFPDYVLYKTGTDEPIAIIEAKRKGESIDGALKQGIEKYAKPLDIDIVFAIDGTFVKSWSIKSNKELSIDGEILKELVSEQRLLRFIKEGNNIEEVTEEVRHTREELIKIFRWANDLLRKEGLRNLDRFVEFANILFIKIISEIEDDREIRGLQTQLDKSIRWESFCKESDPKKMLNYINDSVLKNGLANEYNHTDDIFQEKLKIQNPNTVKEIVNKLSGLKLINTESEIKGDAFEYFLKSLASGNDLGEYFTPRHLVKLMVKLVNPKYGNNIFDPFCGTGGFLIEAFRHVKKGIDENDEKLMNVLKEESIFGVELTDTYKIAKMNMIITGDGHNNIVQSDTAKDEYWNKIIENERDKEKKTELVKKINKLKKEGFDIILSNIPYAQTTDFGNLYPVPSSHGDSIFIQHIIKYLKNNGKCAVIVPEGFLFRKEQRDTRKYLLENCSLNAIISLPAGIFLPYTGVKTDILIFEKGKPTKEIWYFRIDNDGFELNIGRRKISGKNDLDLLLEIWEEKSITEKSWKVNIKDIDKKNYILAIIKKETKIKSQYPLIELGNEEYFRIVGGGTPSREKEEYFKGNILWFTPSDLTDSKILYINNSQEKITKEAIKDSSAKIIPKNSVLLTTRATVGVVKICEKEFTTNQGIQSFICNEKKIYSEYLAYCLMGLKQKIIESSNKTTFLEINKTNLKKLKIPVPSLKEQEEIINKIRNYRELMESSIITLNKMRKVGYGSEMFSNLAELETLGQYAKIENGYAFESKDYTSAGINLVRIGDIKFGYVSNEELVKLPLEFKEKYKKFELRRGDILIAMTGATVGKIGMVSEESLPALLNQRVGKFKIINKIIPEYLFYLTSSEFFQIEIRKRAIGGAQPNISPSQIESIKIPVPEEKMQLEVSEKLRIFRNTTISLSKAIYETEQRIMEIIQSLY